MSSSAAHDRRLLLVYHFCRLQVAGLQLSEGRFRAHLDRMYVRAQKHTKSPVTNWEQFLRDLHAVDAFVAAACLEGDEHAWQTLLFDARVGKSERRLADALRTRAVKLYPGNEEMQNGAVDDFWGHLLVSESEGSVPILARYDGQRPLVPWLICIFQNWQISRLRTREGRNVSLEEDDVLEDRYPAAEPTPHWHEAFCDAAREWLAQVADRDELLLLGLLWRYRLSQREAARMFGIHEGTISRRVKHLAEHCLQFVEERLRTAGWTEDNMSSFLYREMAGVLLDEPRLSVENLAGMLRERNLRPPPG